MTECAIEQTCMYLAIHHPIVAAGVEEEFHVVGLATRQLTAQAGRLMEQLPVGSFSSEPQRSVLEANSRPRADLTDLAEDIAALMNTTGHPAQLSANGRAISPVNPTGTQLTATSTGLAITAYQQPAAAPGADLTMPGDPGYGGAPRSWSRPC